MTKQSTPILLLLLVFSLSLAGQRQTFNPAPLRSSSFTGLLPDGLEQRLVTDTLNPPAFNDECSGNLISFGFTQIWGTLSGMNQLGDTEKAQLIPNATNTTISITEALVLFDYVEVVGNGNLRVKVYALDPATGKPGTQLGQSDDIKADQILADPMEVLVTSFPFSTPVALADDDFVIGVDFTDLYTSADTTGILQTELECGSGSDAFERLPEDGSWATMFDSWSDETGDFDMNFGIFAVVEFDETTAVNDPYYQQGHLRLRPATPNPSREVVRLNYELEKAASVQIEIYSPDGRRLQNRNLGLQPAGVYTEDVDLDQFAAGSYIYSIMTDGARVISRFIVE